MPVVRTDGRSGGVRSRDYQIFSGWVDLLSHGAPHARALRASWAPLLTTFWSIQELLPKILWNRDFIQPSALKVAFQTIIFAKLLDFIWPRCHHSKTVNLKIFAWTFVYVQFSTFLLKKSTPRSKGRSVATQIPPSYAPVLVACVASVSVRFRSKERGTRVKMALVSFLVRPKPRIPFLGLSLLRNQTKTLSTQATVLDDHLHLADGSFSPYAH